MASKQKYTPVESGSLGLGSAGSKVLTGAGTPDTGAFIAITALEDTTFSLLTPEDTLYPDATALTQTVPAGVTIYGRWTAVTVSAGAVIAYNG